MNTQTLYKRIEKLTGQSIENLQRETLTEKRSRISLQKKQALRFTRNFPLIGRGCVLGDHLRTSEKLNKELNALMSSRR